MKAYYAIQKLSDEKPIFFWGLISGMTCFGLMLCAINFQSLLIVSVFIPGFIFGGAMLMGIEDRFEGKEPVKVFMVLLLGVLYVGIIIPSLRWGQDFSIKTASLQGVIGAIATVVITGLLFKRKIALKHFVQAVVFGEISAVVMISFYTIGPQTYAAPVVFVIWQPLIAWIIDGICTDKDSTKTNSSPPEDGPCPAVTERNT